MKDPKYKLGQVLDTSEFGKVEILDLFHSALSDRWVYEFRSLDVPASTFIADDVQII